MTTPAKILVIEDEPAIREGLLDVLVFHGYDVDDAANGVDGLAKARSGHHDLVLLDVMLPGIDGFEVCEQIRAADRELAIIMLTARSGDDDIIQGLKLGADDYVAKPFSIQQLVLRIEAVLRRTLPDLDASRWIKLANAAIDTANLSGTANGRDVEFTRREIEILKYLCVRGDRAVSREELLNKVWGYSHTLNLETRTVDIHIAKLRRKIEVEPASPANLVTVRGIGYRLVTVESS